MLAFLGVVGYFLRIGLGVTGAAFGPSVGADSSTQENETNGVAVGGGTPVQAGAAGPPPGVARLLVELRGRVARNPRDSAALASLSSLYIDAAKYAPATGYYERALAVDPKNAEALFDKATVEDATGHRTAAIAAYRTFLRIAPSNERAGDARQALERLGG
jgi:tetratricopeptide (TPR) repeat protein